MSLVNRISFDDWIKYLFDRPTSKPEWYYKNDDDPEWLNLLSHSAIIVQYITQTFENSGAILKKYSNEQVTGGLNYIINPAISDLSSAIFDVNNDVNIENRLKCIDAIVVLFEQLFAQRCSPYLSHLNIQNGNPINKLCYMWWDILPIHGQPSEPQYAKIDEKVLNVISRILELGSDQCRESSLHGLSEWHPHYPRIVESIIDRFLAANPRISSSLKDYALKARWGAVP